MGCSATRCARQPKHAARTGLTLRWTNCWWISPPSRLVAEPERFDVIITTNLFGDILSDEAAYWMGGMGLAPSINWGERRGPGRAGARLCARISPAKASPTQSPPSSAPRCWRAMPGTWRQPRTALKARSTLPWQMTCPLTAAGFPPAIRQKHHPGGSGEVRIRTI